MCFSPISCVCSIETTRSRNMRTWPIRAASLPTARSDRHAAEREDAPRVVVGSERGPEARRAGREARPEPSRTKSAIARASASASPGGTRRPLCPFSTTSSRPSTARADDGPPVRERVRRDAGARRVPVRTDDGVRGGEPQSALAARAGSAARDGRPRAPRPRAAAPRPTARPRGRAARAAPRVGEPRRRRGGRPSPCRASGGR